MKNKDYY